MSDGVSLRSAALSPTVLCNTFHTAENPAEYPAENRMRGISGATKLVQAVRSAAL